MSDERTEKATPKRREDAKKKGQIARGAEVPAALAFLGSLVTLNVMSGDIFKKVGIYIQSTAQHVATAKPLTDVETHQLFLEAGTILTVMTVPVMLVSFAAVVAGNFAQGGLTLTPSALMPKADRFNPVSNIKKIFGPDSIINLIKSILKLALIGAVTYTVLSPIAEKAPTLVHAPLASLTSNLGETLYKLAMRVGLVMLVLSAAEYGYTWYKNEKSMRMTKQEIRDEYKEQEGDPMVKGQRRRVARELTQKRSMAAVPTASVVITNPTHISIALRYDRDKDAAPVVVAVGADNIAAKIREIAKANDIPMVENVPLARALYKVVEPNQIIPVEFFGAVAEILAYVFRTREA